MEALSIKAGAAIGAALAYLGDAAAFAADGATVEDMTAGTTVLHMLSEGRTVGAFAVELQGSTLFCTALAARPGADALALADAWGREAARKCGATALACKTKRPGIARALRRLGYTEAREGNVFTMKKRLRHGQ